MGLRFEILCIHHLILLTTVVCPQATVVGFVGNSVIIPCSSGIPVLAAEDITVRWRYNNNLKLYDIIKGKDSVVEQSPAFKNRAETFPKEYLKGNLSLKLNNLQYRDRGKYTCYLIEESIQRSVELIVEDRPVRERINRGTSPRPEVTVIISILCIALTFLLLTPPQFFCAGPQPEERRRGLRRIPVHTV